MPARVFIKSCKCHTGLFSCGRCIVKGETINHARVFKEINCEERTLESFRQKLHPNHQNLLNISNFKLATLKSQYVKNILKTFVELMPHYGPCSQTINIHNLIHSISDDVVNMHTPISLFSAFDFENSLGYIKSIIKSPTNPISQIQKKLHIFHTGISPNNISLDLQTIFY